MTDQNTRLGILLMVLTTFVFASQDTITRFLGARYDIFTILMLRYWFFAAFVVFWVSRKPGGLRSALRPKRPFLQILRGVLLVVEVAVIVHAFVAIGLTETHAVFAAYPLIIVALSGPVLGEKVGWRRWSAIGIGFLGVLVILQPGFGVFQPGALIALAAAVLFAIYGLLTRYVSREDSSDTAFFWTGITGAVVATFAGIWNLEPMPLAHAGLTLLLGVAACASHGILIRAYELAEASAIQPFAYLQLPFATLFGILLFDETLRPNVAVGAALVVLAGVFTLWRTRQKEKAQQP